MDGTTEPIVAVIGNPIAGNPTQFALETGFQAAQIDSRVFSIDLASDKVAAALAGMNAMGFRGVWVAPSCRPAVAQSGENEHEKERENGKEDDSGEKGDSALGCDAASLLDLLVPTSSGDGSTTWDFHSTKCSVWMNLARQSLSKRRQVCRRLWWVDSKADLSAEAQATQQQALLEQVQKKSDSVWEPLQREQIEMVSDLTQTQESSDCDEQGVDVIVLAGGMAAPDSDWNWLPHSLLIDLSENWDANYLAAWDRLKMQVSDDSTRDLLRGADVHAACLSQMTELVFGKQVASGVFLEAIDEYLAV